MSDLLDATVVDEQGHGCGRIRDVRVVRESEAGGHAIVGLVIGAHPLAHGWGFVEGRATGPWLLKALTARGARTARFVPAERVRKWGPSPVVIAGRGVDLPGLAEELRR